MTLEKGPGSMSRLALRPIGVLGVALLSWVPPSPAQGVVGTPLPLGEPASPASVPFGPGERATYRVRDGLFGGEGDETMQGVDLVALRGQPTSTLPFAIRHGIPAATTAPPRQPL